MSRSSGFFGEERERGCGTQNERARVTPTKQLSRPRRSRIYSSEPNRDCSLSVRRSSPFQQLCSYAVRSTHQTKSRSTDPLMLAGHTSIEYLDY